MRHTYRHYKRKSSRLEVSQREKMQSLLLSLQKAILQKEKPLASTLAHQVDDLASKWMPKTFWDQLQELLSPSAIAVALGIAIIVRSMWFEPYTIPTGSMRPTFKEGDFILASKTDYGINVPLAPSHFYFDPALVERGAIVILTSENMDVSDSDTMHFYLFPGKKQFIKRFIGKPGDTLYFYGGQIYGINQLGQELKELRDPEWMQKLEHIPFIRFDGQIKTSGKPIQGRFPSISFFQMNEPVAKLELNAVGAVKGEMIAQGSQPAVKHFGDLWGFKNYAMARLLKPAEAAELFPLQTPLPDAPLYLELIHHPALEGASLIRDEYGRLRPGLSYSRSFIPLSQEKIERIASHLTTARFIVKNGVAYRYGISMKNPSQFPYFPQLSDVPDGTYEIQDGTAYEVLWGGITKKLPTSHPLYRKDPERIYLLYNLGIEFETGFLPSVKLPNRFPSRYAYFRDQQLYLLGAPIFEKEDPELILFLKQEYQKQSMSTSVRPYFPFDDMGAPLKDDKIDVQFLKKYGLTIPDKMYLVLGDNHAMSADSRQFGFVPEDNLRGGASLIFWPPGSRFGRPPQAPIQHLSIPNITVWTLAVFASLIAYIWHRRCFARPLRFKDNAKQKSQ